MNKIQRFSIFSLAFAVWIGVSLACAMVSPKEGPPKVSTGTALSQTPAIPSSKSGEAAELLGYSLTVTKVEDRPSTDSYNTPKPITRKVQLRLPCGCSSPRDRPPASGESCLPSYTACLSFVWSFLKSQTNTAAGPKK